MYAIGIRCSPSCIYYSIIKGSNTSSEIINVDKIVLPKSMDLPGKLKYFRSTLLDIIEEYNITGAGIRATEPNSQTLSIDRLYCEGIALEVFANSEILNYYVGHISSISAKIGIDRTDFKEIVEGRQLFDRVAAFTDFCKEEKESVLACLGALN